MERLFRDFRSAPLHSNPETPSASIVLKVSDYNQARSQVMKLAGARGAGLHEESSQVSFAGERHGNIILELDADQLPQTIEGIRGIGKLYSERVQTSDQTSYYERLERRMSLLKQNEVELLAFLHGFRRMRGSDILFVQYRLYQSRVQAADAAQERADTARRARKAMLNVALFEPEPHKTFDWGNWHAVASYRAKGSFLYVTRKLVTVFYLAVFLAPYWIPALLIVFFGGRKLIRWTRQQFAAWLQRRTATGREAL
jgi:hypothetical protein